jgi:hypothetical protein
VLREDSAIRERDGAAKPLQAHSVARVDRNITVKKLAVITWKKAYLLQNGPGALAANLRAHRGLNAYQRIGMAEKNESL